MTQVGSHVKRVHFTYAGGGNPIDYYYYYYHFYYFKYFK